MPSGLVCSNPARVLELSLNLLATHFLGKVGNADPEHTDGKEVVASLVVHGDFNLVGLVNVELVVFVDPAVVPGGLSAALDGIFNLDVDESLGASTKATRSGMVNVGNGVDAQREVTAERLPLTRHAQAVVWCGVSKGGRCEVQQWTYRRRRCCRQYRRAGRRSA